MRGDSRDESGIGFSVDALRKDRRLGSLRQESNLTFGIANKNGHAFPVRVEFKYVQSGNDIVVVMNDD